MFRAIPRTTIGAATVEARALGPERQDIDGDGPGTLSVTRRARLQ